MSLYTCSEVAERLYDLLDEEQSPEEGTAMERHLAGCEPCRQRLEVEREFLAAVRETCRASHAPEGLLQRIQQSLEQPSLQGSIDGRR
jgi:mycothiol system anti-sigma-R factor